MIKRSIGVGLLVGAIFALVAVYPTIRIFGAPAGALGDQPSVFRSLLLAANIGDDTDTIGAIAGSTMP